MKKTFLTVLSLFVISASIGISYAKTATNTELTEIIKLYKAENYSECYMQLEAFLEKDPSNALAYYYKAITSVQLGRKDEAIRNYDKALSLTSGNNNLSRFAKKGKRCLETPDKCEESIFGTIDDEFIQSRFGAKSSEEVNSSFEKLKIEQLMREINRNENIDPQRFKEYKDFSGAVPTNDEIVAAMRTLQNAGFGNIISNSHSDLSVFTGNSQNNSLLNMMGNSSLNPQLIQALLTNNMAQGF